MAGLELLLASLLLAVIWIALPARWWPVDLTGSALALGFAVGALGLLMDRPWGRLLSRAVNWFCLLAGLSAVSALFFTAAHLAGLYGPIGAGGALIMATAATMVLPYLIALPALQLALLSNLGQGK